MMKSILLFLLAILFACSPSTSKRNNIINEQKMVLVMADVYLLEMHYQKKYGAPAAYKKTLDEALKSLFSKHGVTRASYEKSFTYYAENHEKFMEMNDAVIQRYNSLILEK